MNDYRLVYSTDKKLNQRCSRCKELQSECTCKADVEIPNSITAYLRLEKAHRGGKTVTVVDRLPASEPYLKKLAKELKAACGCGGTFKIEENGIIELQGDRREILRVELVKRGIKVK